MNGRLAMVVTLSLGVLFAAPSCRGAMAPTDPRCDILPFPTTGPDSGITGQGNASSIGYFYLPFDEGCSHHAICADVDGTSCDEHCRATQLPFVTREECEVACGLAAGPDAGSDGG